MRKRTKIWLVIASSLVLAGCIIFGGLMIVLKWDFTKFETVKYETNEYEIIDNFSNISIETDTADIIFALSDDGKCKVKCYEERKANHSVTVQDDTLVINIINKKSWYDYIGINFGSPKITVYLPKAEYTSLLINESTGDIKIPKEFKMSSVDISLSTGDVDFYAVASEYVKIKTSTGNIRMDNTSVGAVDLTVSTGEITVSNVICDGDTNIKVSTGRTKLTDIKCKNLTSSGSTGNISLNNVVALEKFSIKRSTGDVRFNSSDAAEIFVKTDTGEVVGSLLTDKVFITHTDTGRVDVPKTVSGGRCEITSDTGDIKINIIS